MTLDFTKWFGWKPIESAPKDGTIVEIRCKYGIDPWYGEFKWSNTRGGWWMYPDNSGGIEPTLVSDDELSWREANGVHGLGCFIFVIVFIFGIIHGMVT